MAESASSNFDVANVTIRLANEGDHDAVRELFLQGAEEGHLRENDTGADVVNLEEGYFADDGASGFWVACVGDLVIGMIGVQRTREDTAEVRRLRVDHAYRRRGVATLLMEEATKFCRNLGYLKVVLDVRVDRGPAIAMFEKFGFKLARDRVMDVHRTLDFFMDLYSDPN